MDSVIKAISTIAAQSHLDQSVLVIGSSRPARPLTQTIKQKKQWQQSKEETILFI